jgi:hypothetical protein
MAKQILVKLLDDLTGGEATETVRFAYDGLEYTIDLSDKNAAKLRKALAPFVDNGVKVGPGKPSKVQHTPNVPIEETVQGRAMIRQWARRYMFDRFPNLGDKGRIPAEVVAAYYDFASNARR